MREMIIAMLSTATIGQSLFANTTVQNPEFWERVAERWGIGLVGLLIAAAMGWLLYRKDNLTNAERLAMQSEIKEINKQQLEQMKVSAEKSEKLQLEYIKAQNENAVALRMLTLKLKHKGCLKDSEEI